MLDASSCFSPCAGCLTRVVAAGLAPTNEFSLCATDDREFLRQMLDGEAARCFDVLAAHDYGYGLPPDDPHGEYGGLNLARLLDLRAILDEVRASQPVWITDLGYTVEPGLHPHVSLSDQAEYLLGAFRRVRAEWPWVEKFAVWNLSYTGGTPEMQRFSIIEPDRAPRLRSSFTHAPRTRRSIVEDLWRRHPY